MRRRRLPPDNRPDWRDPEMPVLMLVDDSGVKHLESFERQVVEQYMQWLNANNPEPDWHNDPTYNLRRRRHGR